MKKLICVLLLVALCLPFAAAEENPYPFMEISFDQGIVTYLPELVKLYGGEEPEYVNFTDTVYSWNDYDKNHLGRLMTYKPADMNVGGYTVSSVDLVELVADYDHSMTRMAYIQMNYDVLPGRESEVYDRVCADIGETYGEGKWNVDDAQWVTTMTTEWAIDEDMFLGAELWISKRNGSCTLKVCYGLQDFDFLCEMMTEAPVQ